jgi:hypothetical protein
MEMESKMLIFHSISDLSYTLNIWIHIISYLAKNTLKKNEKKDKYRNLINTKLEGNKSTVTSSIVWHFFWWFINYLFC